MEKNIRKVFGDDLSKSVENILKCFELQDLTQEQLAEKIKDMSEIVRNVIYDIALFEEKKELADKIKGAMKIIDQNEIATFKKSVEEGTYEEFLSTLSMDNKFSLFFNMGFYFDSSSDIQYTNEEKRYYDIIESSINKDMEEEALRQGFPSVDAWKRYNSEVQTESYLDITLEDMEDPELKI